MVTWGSAFFKGRKTIIEINIGGDGWNIVSLALDEVDNEKQPSEIFLSLFTEIIRGWQRGAINVYENTPEITAMLMNEWTFILDPKWGSIEASIPNEVDLEDYSDLDYYIVPMGNIMIWYSVMNRKLDRIEKIYSCLLAEIDSEAKTKIEELAKDLDYTFSFRPALEQLVPGFFDKMHEYLEERSQAKAEDFDRAIKEIRQQYSESSDIDKIASRGNNFVNSENPEQAKECFAEVFKSNPHHLNALWGSAIIAREEKNWEIFEKMSRELKEHYPSHTETIALDCSIAKLKGTLNQKTRVFEESVVKRGADPLFWRDLSLHYSYLEDHTSFLRAAIAYQLLAGETDSQTRLVNSFLSNTAKKLEKTIWDMYFSIASLRIEPSSSANIGGIIKGIVKYLQKTKEKPNGENKKETRKEKKKRKQEHKTWQIASTKWVEYLTEVFPEDGRTWGVLALYNLTMGNVKKASEYLERGLASGMVVPVLYFLKTKIMLQKGENLEEMITYQKKGLAGDPENAQEWFNLAVMYLKKMKKNESDVQVVIQTVTESLKAYRKASHFFDPMTDFAQWVPEVDEELEDLKRLHPKLKLMWHEFTLIKMSAMFVDYKYMKMHFEEYLQDLKDVIDRKVIFSGMWGFMMAGLQEVIQYWYDGTCDLLKQLEEAVEARDNDEKK